MVKRIQRRLLSVLSFALALAPLPGGAAERSRVRLTPAQPWSEAEGFPPPHLSAPAGARAPMAPHRAIHSGKRAPYGPASLFPRFGADERNQVHFYVVRPGDTLWDIAARVMGTDDPRRVARYWPRIHRVNRAVIGPDPSLIRPGQVLELPRADDVR